MIYFNIAYMTKTTQEPDTGQDHKLVAVKITVQYSFLTVCPRKEGGMLNAAEEIA